MVPREPADREAVVGVIPHMQCVGVCVVEAEPDEIVVDELGASCIHSCPFR